MQLDQGSNVFPMSHSLADIHNPGHEILSGDGGLAIVEVFEHGLMSQFPKALIYRTNQCRAESEDRRFMHPLSRMFYSRCHIKYNSLGFAQLALRTLLPSYTDRTISGSMQNQPRPKNTPWKVEHIEGAT